MPHESLDGLKIFQDFTEEERREILTLTQPVEVNKGEQIITQGHHKQNLWFILEGRCQITRRTESGCQLNLAELEPFTHFGEMSFFHPAPHSADVVALTDMKLLRLTREAFDKLAATGCGSALKLVVNCVRVLAERLRRTDQWITELECKENHKPTPSEWTVFRDLIFKGG
ncbi:Crp/Fnr family transcriptional regulator [Bythopirellula goksoeyrii]|uniref:cAMP receptor protein n=1 Tax=Bythopirellula goksoeyrii TaxID=1400387 RepID=A0A5B9Q2D9_9BACT|nr:cyclic nucleotide-binding domain-containing protein [Bythopirellula goksoeyrii]QEG33168.1 cAMP receptor protein [Bythopirellula goksoeyrii]